MKRERGKKKKEVTEVETSDLQISDEITVDEAKEIKGHPVHEAPANVDSTKINVCSLPFKCLKRLVFRVVRE